MSRTGYVRKPARSAAHDGLLDISLPHGRGDTLRQIGAGFRTKLAKYEWVERPFIQCCRLGVRCILIVHLIRTEAEVLQVDALNEGAIGDDTLLREHDRVDIHHDVAS